MRKRQQRKKPWLWMAAGAMLVALVIGGYTLYTRYVALPEKAEITSIAVLPFEDMSPEKDQEWFCEGISDAILTALTHVGELQVPGRTSSFSFKGKDTSFAEIGRQLNVEAVLEGSIMKSGNRLRITAQLINVSDGYHLWAEEYDREMEDVFDIRDEISLTIVNELKVKLLGEEKVAIEKRPTENIEAFALYLQGRHFWNLRSGPQINEMLRKGLDYFQQAVEKDPDYALAYTGIADSYHKLGFGHHLPREEAYREAEKAAKKALELDNTLAEVHVSLGTISLMQDKNFTTAEREYKRAVELNPNSALAHYWYGGYLITMGKYNDALDKYKRARMLDPLDWKSHRDIIRSYRHMGIYDEAIKECYKAIELFPKYRGTANFYHQLINIYYEQGKYLEMLPVVQLARENLGNSTWGEMWLGSIYALSGERSKAEQILQKGEDLWLKAWIYSELGEKEKVEEILNELIEQSKKEDISPWAMAYIYEYWDELDKAMDWLEKFYEEDTDMLLNNIRLFELYNKDIRSHPRYKALLKKMGLE
ncbi:tetratricopeptide repeat protein [Candidatus Latescibacterota bacterium]